LITPGLLAAGTLLLGACADRHAGEARAAQTALVGMPKPVLLSCAGAPDRTEVANDTEYLTYVAGPTAGASSNPRGSLGVAGGSGGGFGMGVGLGFNLGGGYSSDGCIATFTLQGDRVTRLVYRDNTVGNACYSIVENCLSTAPPAR
jgi:hypothetical protein